MPSLACFDCRLVGKYTSIPIVVGIRAAPTPRRRLNSVLPYVFIVLAAKACPQTDAIRPYLHSKFRSFGTREKINGVDPWSTPTSPNRRECFHNQHWRACARTCWPAPIFPTKTWFEDKVDAINLHVFQIANLNILRRSHGANQNLQAPSILAPIDAPLDPLSVLKYLQRILSR